MGRKQALAERADAPELKDPVDPEPHELYGAVTEPLSIRQQVQQFVKNELSAAAKAQGLGSFEDEDDFEDDDEFDAGDFSLGQLEHQARELRAEAPPGVPAETLDGQDDDEETVVPEADPPVDQGAA